MEIAGATLKLSRRADAWHRCKIHFFFFWQFCGGASMPNSFFAVVYGIDTEQSTADAPTADGRIEKLCFFFLVPKINVSISSSERN